MRTLKNIKLDYMYIPLYNSLFKELNKEKYNVLSVYDYFIKNKGSKNKANVIIRIDVDWGLEESLELARDLKKYNLRGSFYFLTFPERYYNIWESKVPKEISNMGFEVGIHSDHYFEQLTKGINAIKKIKEDVKKLSEIIKKPIYGMTYHGSHDMAKLGKRNDEIYDRIDPKLLGLEYHDGSCSVYIKKKYPYTPNTDYHISDWIGINFPWFYHPLYPIKKLRKMRKGESIHMVLYPPMKELISEGLNFYINWLRVRNIYMKEKLIEMLSSFGVR